MTPTGKNEKGYHKLVAWQAAHQLALAVYRATESFPRAEMFGLMSQMRRAAVSVAANIVEGQARRGDKEFLRFLIIANGSLAELEYYFEVVRDLGFLSAETYEQLDEMRFRVGYLLHGLIESKGQSHSAP